MKIAGPKVDGEARTPVCLNLPWAMKGRLRERAEQEGRAMSRIVEAAVVQYLAQAQAEEAKR